MNDKYIEVHLKRGKQIFKVSVAISFIVKVTECKSGTFICFLLGDGYGSLSRFRCIESYDEVMALIDS